jgi:hypothetical protein
VTNDSLQANVDNGKINVPAELDSYLTTSRMKLCDLILILASATGRFDIFENTLQSSIEEKKLDEEISTTLKNVFHFCDGYDMVGSLEQQQLKPSRTARPTPTIVAGQLEDEIGQELLHGKWQKLSLDTNLNCASLFMGYVICKDHQKPGYHVSPTGCPTVATMREAHVSRILNHEEIGKEGKKGILGTLYGFDQGTTGSTINASKFLVWPYALSCCDQNVGKGGIPVNMALRGCGVVEWEKDQFITRANQIEKSQVMMFIDIMKMVR